jgi:hypothetical protein
MSTRVPAEVAQAEAEIAALTAGLRPHFRRGVGHRHAGEDVRGLLGPVERKDGWQLAEHAGHRHPRTIRRVLARPAWDADAVRDDLREHPLAEPGEEVGVPVVAETGFLKKGIWRHGCSPDLYTLRSRRRHQHCPSANPALV